MGANHLVSLYPYSETLEQIALVALALTNFGLLFKTALTNGDK